MTEHAEDAVATDPNTARGLAQQWHEDAGHGNWEPHFSTCWCCCTGCSPNWGGTNPHYTAAMRKENS